MTHYAVVVVTGVACAERIINNATCNIWAEKNPIESKKLLDLFKHLFD